MSGLEVVKAGILTTIQDSGRSGFMDYGITKSGVMDLYAYEWLNKLLENKPNTNCLEVVFGDVEFKVKCETYIAITGAECEFSINEKSTQNWQVCKLCYGDSIKIGKLLSGTRVYIGVKGGFNVLKELGSSSSTLKEKIGGDKLKNKDILECKSFLDLPLKKLQKKFIPEYKKELTLRVVLGYQEDSFSKEEKEKFFNSSYIITTQNNKMGYKLSGEKIKSKLDGIISEAISLGSIQIPKDGQPIILLNERQTIGGYPKIGTVLPIDCYRLAQMEAGSTIQFKQISLQDAIKKEKLFKKSFLN